MRPRVFVSSIIEEFQEYREAARNGIVASGGDPILVEDYPGLAISPRTACLDGVASCDIFIVVIGDRGGWTAPSGKLVVEEEYEEARKRKKPTLAFIQKVERDEEAERLACKLSDYVNGMFRPTFFTPAELQSAVEKALAPIINHHSNPEVDLTMIEEKLKEPYQIYNEASLRFVLVPERVEELIDPVYLESPELKNQLFELGHSPEVQLFSYEWPKKVEVGINEIVILQSEEGSHRDGVDEARLELTTLGLIVIDVNVTGRAASGQWDDSVSSFAITEDDINYGLKKSFAFVRVFLEAKDPFKRYNRLLYNSALSGLGYRTLMKGPSRDGSCPMGHHGDQVIIAYERPRLIVREDLLDSQKEIEATLTLFRRRL